MSELNREEHDRWYGRVAVDPGGPMVTAGYGTWRVTYTVGRYGMDNGGRIRILRRFSSDMGVPQTEDPQGDNYLTAISSNPNARIDYRFDRKGGHRPWLQALIFEIKDEALAEGDQVMITLGDTSGGSRGHQAQSFVESAFYWLTEVECFETGTWVALQSSPAYPVIAGVPDRLIATVPSYVTATEPFTANIRCIDAGGNVAHSYTGSVTLRVEDLDGHPVPGWEEQTLTFDGDIGMQRTKDLTLTEPGSYRVVAVEQPGGRRAVSNPICVLADPPALGHYWGDLHGQYYNGLGVGTVAEVMTYARDAADVRFAGHQPNDFHFHQAGWDEVRNTLPAFHEPGRFVPFLGYEWSGNTPAGGDRNVHYLGDDGPLHRTSHWHIADKSDIHMDRYPLDELFRELRGRRDVFLVPHVGGRRCDISAYHDPDLEPVIEIASCHGRFEWLLREAIENGYTVGVIGGSDDHTGRPGAAYATSHGFGTRGGLAAVYAPELSREGLAAALRARHCYGTTGERIILAVTTAGGQMMGDAWSAPVPPDIRVQATGTRPLERVEIVRNLDTVYRLPLFSRDDFSPTRVRIEWGGARVRGRGRWMPWDGSVRVDGARILTAEAVAFDHPAQGITAQDETSVHWASTTSGDHDAIILSLDGPGGVLHIDTPEAQVVVRAEDLMQGPLRRECGGVDGYLEVRPQPLHPGPLQVDFTWTDPQPLPGRNAYWIRVVQQDGEMAWSSPLYWEALAGGCGAV